MVAGCPENPGLNALPTRAEPPPNPGFFPELRKKAVWAGGGLGRLTPRWADCRGAPGPGAKGSRDRRSWHQKGGTHRAPWERPPCFPEPPLRDCRPQLTSPVMVREDEAVRAWAGPGAPRPAPGPPASSPRSPACGRCIALGQRGQMRHSGPWGRGPCEGPEHPFVTQPHLGGHPPPHCGVTLHQAGKAWVQAGRLWTVSLHFLDPDSHCVHPMDPPMCSPHQGKGLPRPLLTPAAPPRAAGTRGECSLEQPGPRAHLAALRSQGQADRKSTRLNSSHSGQSRMPSSA